LKVCPKTQEVQRCEAMANALLERRMNERSLLEMSSSSTLAAAFRQLVPLTAVKLYTLQAINNGHLMWSLENLLTGPLAAFNKK
jgi:hypothetical protein